MSNNAAQNQVNLSDITMDEVRQRQELMEYAKRLQESRMSKVAPRPLPPKYFGGQE